MVKRILSFLLGLSVLIAALPFGFVSAEETAVPQSSNSVAAEITLTEPDFPEKVTSYKTVNSFAAPTEYIKFGSDNETGASINVADGKATVTAIADSDAFNAMLYIKAAPDANTDYISVHVDTTKLSVKRGFELSISNQAQQLYNVGGATYYFMPDANEENPNPELITRKTTGKLGDSIWKERFILYPGEVGTIYIPETVFFAGEGGNTVKASQWNGDFDLFIPKGDEWRMTNSNRHLTSLRFNAKSGWALGDSVVFSNMQWVASNSFPLNYNAEYIAEDFSDAETVEYTYWSGSNHKMNDDNFAIEDGVWKHTATAEDWTDEASTLRYGHTLNLGYPVNGAFEAMQFDVDFSNISVEPVVQMIYNVKNIKISQSDYVRRFVVANGDIYAVWENGVVETIASQNKEWAWATLPKGFKGTVIIPFESLKTMTVGNYTYDGTTVDLFKNDDVNDYGLTIDMMNIPYSDKGDVITYDNFGFLTTLKPTLENGTVFDAKAPIEVDKRIAEEIKTVETWVKIPAGTAEGTILAEKYRKNGTSSFVLKMNASGNPVLYLCDGAGHSVTFEVADVDLRTDKWTHIAFSKNETAINFYVNGTIKATTEIPEGLAEVKPYHVLTIGHQINSELSSATFGGEVANLKLWSKALTSSEILNSAINEAVNADGLIAAWTLSGENKLADISGKYNAEVYDLLITAEDEDYAEFSSIPENGYTFAVIPDTQIAAQREAIDEVGTYTSFSGMYDWIVENKEEQNIKFVMGLGDITNADRAEEYILAKGNCDKLTNAGIPWSIVGGNHDFKGGSVAPNNTTNLNTYFPAGELSTLAGFGGVMEEGKIDNSYYYVTVNETKYLILNLMCEPYDSVLNWASQVCMKNRDCKVIVLTHEYVTNDAKFHNNPYTGRNSGLEVWENFVSKHENIIMAIGGHVAVPDIQYREDLGVNGNKVINVLVDAQALDWKKPSYNMLLLLKFSEDGSKVTLDYYSPTQDLFLDANNHLTLEVDGIVSDEAVPEAPKADYTYSKYHSDEIIRNFEWFVNDGNVSVWSDLKASATSSSQFSWYNNMLKYETADEFNINEETGNPYEKDRIGITFKKLPNVVNEKQSALSFYVDRSSATYTTYIRTRFTCGGGTYQPGKGSIAYYIADNGEITKFENGSNWSSVALPAGFKGTVVIPFTSFKTNDGNGDFIDTSKLLCETQQNNAQLTMYIMEARADEVYLFNNISYVEEYHAEDLVIIRNGIMDEENGELIDVTGDSVVDARDIVRLKKVLADFYL